MAKRAFNHPVNHIGLAVPDVEVAQKWYMDVFGFRQLRPISFEDRDANEDTVVLNILPSVVSKVKLAYLGTGNSVGIELFEFIDPKTDPRRETHIGNGQHITLGGFFHFAITTPDIEAMRRKVLECGGKAVGGVGTLDGEEGTYVQDPWGNIVELITVSYEQLLCNR
ncbi:hypothetical protein DL769_007037 [Monosporascus sp. CRB-8-3]|nr:hypothetical protein DL769_007037 [Monosporascus sp. CRB-8-3]